MPKTQLKAVAAASKSAADQPKDKASNLPLMDAKDHIINELRQQRTFAMDQLSHSGAQLAMTAAALEKAEARVAELEAANQTGA